MSEIIKLYTNITQSYLERMIKSTCSAILGKMTSKVPYLKLNNGERMPILGIGTWNSPVGEVTQAIKDAIDVGYRHIDGAFAYSNETEVGEAVNAKIKEGVLKREDLFITSKLTNTYHRPDLVRNCLKLSLERLNTTYVDLYLIHWPMAWIEVTDTLFPKNEKGEIIRSDVDYVDTWKEMEKLVDSGLAKSIGVSNFNKRQLERLLANCRIRPAVNQVECHPYLAQLKLTSFLKECDITLTSYCPLGSPSRPIINPNDPVLLDDPQITALAKKYNKTRAQILIRYQIDRGHIVIPKSVTKKRIRENFDVFDFQINEDDIQLLNNLDRNVRYCKMAIDYGNPFHPFEHDEY